MPLRVWCPSSRLAAPRKVATKRVRRARVQLAGRTHFEQASQVHHADAVGEREGFFLVVRDQHRRDAEFALDLADRAAAAPRGSWRRGRRTARRAAALRACAQAARATATRCCWPPESCAGRRSSMPSRATSRSSSCATGGRSARFMRRDAQRELDVVRHRHVAEQGVVLEHEARRRARAQTYV